MSDKQIVQGGRLFFSHVLTGQYCNKQLIQTHQRFSVQLFKTKTLKTIMKLEIKSIVQNNKVLKVNEVINFKIN